MDLPGSGGREKRGAGGVVVWRRASESRPVEFAGHKSVGKPQGTTNPDGVGGGAGRLAECPPALAPGGFGCDSGGVGPGNSRQPRSTAGSDRAANAPPAGGGHGPTGSGHPAKRQFAAG